jgi:hypothetical protein
VLKPSNYQKLRERILKGNPETLSIESQAESWGVVMEMRWPVGSATLFALADGRAGLYLSSGIVLVGERIRMNIHKAATAFLARAVKESSAMQETDDFGIPDAGTVRFYLLSRSSVLTTQGPELELLNGSHELSGLFFSGHEVITQLRSIQELPT